MSTIRALRPVTEDDLVREHLPLVRSVVTSFRNRLPGHVSSEDLTSAAMHGLLLAVRNFDPDRGVPFSAYACTRMRGAMLDDLRSADWASRSLRAKERSLRAVTAAHGSGLEAAAAAAGLSTDEARTVLADVDRAHLLSLDVFVANERSAGSLPADGSTPEVELLERERAGFLHDAVDALPERLRRVVIGSYFEDRPLADLAEELGVTESRISHMRAEAASLLREAFSRSLDRVDGDELSTPSGVAARRRAEYCDSVARRSDLRLRLDRRPPVAVPVPA